MYPDRIKLATLSSLLLLSILSIPCQAAPDYTKVEDPFKAAIKADRLYSAATICFLVTENTQKALDYIDDWNKGVTGALGGLSGFDSKRIIFSITQALQSRFRNATRIYHVSELESRGCEIALSVDIRVTLSPGIRKSGWTSINTAFADGKGVRLENLSAEAEGTSWNSVGEAGSQSWDSVLSQFESKLDASKPLQTFVAGLKPSVPSPATVSQEAIDLAFWESMKNSSNPADFQAYLQKFPKGSFIDLARSRLSALGETAPVKPRPLAEHPGKINFGNYRALVIGIDEYRSVTPLKTAVNDARTLAELLRRDYGFGVSLLLNPTRNQVLDAFDDMRRNLTENDNLLIYYAGHGHLDTDSDRGFWLPVDADARRRANWLSNADITDMVKAVRAKHVLVVADSCYAGTLTRSLAVQTAALDDLSRLAQKRARTALVSGGLEPVEDSGGGRHSVFAKAFMDSLNTNKGAIDMSQLFASMRRQVILNAQQTPQYGDIRQTGHEGGDFIFVRKK